jgi:hypothetical protein
MLLLNGCGFRTVTIEPEITISPGDDYGKIPAWTVKQKEDGSEESTIMLGFRPMKPIFAEDPKAPLKVIQKQSSEKVPDGIFGNVYRVVSFATLTLVPAIESNTQLCEFVVQHCGMTFKTYEVKRKNFTFMWLPLVPFMVWFIDDGIVASFGDSVETCEMAFASEFFQDVKKNPWLSKACTAKP